MRFADIQKMDSPQLHASLQEKRVELDQLRFGVADGALKQVHKIQVVRREIAQIKTALATK